MSDWAPLAHEDSDDEAEKPDAKARKDKPSDPPNKDKPATLDGMPFPMAMAMLIPPDAIAAIMSLAGTQERIASAIDKQTEAMAALTRELKASRGAADKES